MTLKHWFFLFWCGHDWCLIIFNDSSQTAATKVLLLDLFCIAWCILAVFSAVAWIDVATITEVFKQIECFTGFFSHGWAASGSFLCFYRSLVLYNFFRDSPDFCGTIKCIRLKWVVMAFLFLCWPCSWAFLFLFLL